MVGCGGDGFYGIEILTQLASLNPCLLLFLEIFGVSDIPIDGFAMIKAFEPPRNPSWLHQRGADILEQLPARS